MKKNYRYAVKGAMVLGLILLLSAIGLPRNAHAASLIQNGGFESGNLSGWETVSPMFVGAQYTHSGTFGVGFIGTGEIRQVFATTAGQKYTVSGWVRVDQVSVKPTWGGLRVIVTDYGWTQLAQQTVTAVANKTWVAISFTFVAKSNQARLGLSNFSNGKFNAAGDDFNVTSGTVVPTPTKTSVAAPTATVVPPTQPAATATSIPLPTNTPMPTATATGLPTGQTQVTGLSAPPSVGKFLKYEASFTLSRTFTATSMLPYYPFADDPNGITVDVEMTAPSGQKTTLPAFYYQDYTRTVSGNSESVEPTGTSAWKLRFAPQELGAYSYAILVTDATGSTRAGTYTFTSVASNSKGFLRVSPRDPRFMEFTDGSSFVPIARGRQWWQCCGLRAADYERTFDAWKPAGINLTRVWTQDDGYALTIEGHYDAYKYPDDFNPVDRGINIATLPKGTQINQRGAYELDKIIEAAERDGVYLELSLHGDPYWIWPDTVLSGAANSPERIAFWKRNLRYRAARWGYSSNIATVEFINEEGHIAPNSATWNFYAALAPYFNTVDPNHLLTTSQGSQAYSPGFWSSAQTQMDVANYHDYLMSSRYSANLTNDEANFVTRFAWCLRSNTNCASLGLGDGTQWSGGAKPWVWGEFDAGTTVWNQVNPLVATGDGRVRLLHNSAWAGLFSPLGASPIDWYWSGEDAATTQAILNDRKITAQFFAGLDYAGNQFVYGSTEGLGETVTVSDANARVLSMRGTLGTYAWVQQRNYTYSNTPNLPTPISPIVVLPNLNGAFNVQLFNTHNGSTINLGTMVAYGTLSIPVNNLQTDMAIIVKR